MHKLLLYLSFALFFGKNSLSVHFCDTETDPVYAFIIGNDVYFGVNNELWTFGIQSHKLSKSRSFVQLFGQNLTGVLVTGFKISENMLDLNECEKRLRINDSDIECINANKAKDLVIVLCYLEYNLHYYSFRYNKITSVLIPIASEDDMPWSLPTKGEFDSFVINSLNHMRKSYLKDIYQNITKSYTVTGLTFIKNDEILLVSVVSDSLTVDGRIISIPIMGTSVKTHEFKTNAFSGLFNIFGSVYAMDYKRKIFLLDWFNDRYGLNTYYTAKQFFKCEKDSEIETTTHHETTSSGKLKLPDTGSSTTLSSSVTLSPLTTLGSLTTSSPSKSKLKLWIFLLILFVFIVCICLAVFFYCRLKKTKNENEEETARKEETVPKEDIASKEETASKEDIASREASTRTLATS